MCLIIAGKMSTASLLNVLQSQVESSIIKHQSTRPATWKRPFVETATAHRVPLTETLKATVEFPEKDESAGELSMTFVGSAPGDYLTAKVYNLDDTTGS